MVIVFAAKIPFSEIMVLLPLNRRLLFSVGSDTLDVIRYLILAGRDDRPFRLSMLKHKLQKIRLSMTANAL